MPPDSPPALSERANAASGAGWLRLFFVPFFLTGAAFFGVVTVGPLLLIRASRDWPATPCVVESSRVIFHQSDDGNRATYSIEIVFHYTVAGQPRTARRYSFVVGAWSGLRAKEAVVAAYPAGREAVCFVNPKAPDEAVLNRDWQPEMGMEIGRASCRERV